MRIICVALGDRDLIQRDVVACLRPPFEDGLLLGLLGLMESMVVKG